MEKRNKDYPIKTVTALREAFWEAHPEFKEFYIKGARQNQYKTDIRVAWCDFVEFKSRNEEISLSLKYRATL